MTKIKFDPGETNFKNTVHVLIGYWVCLNKFSAYDPTMGEVVIDRGFGLKLPIREAMENEILKYFERDDLDRVFNLIWESKY